MDGSEVIMALSFYVLFLGILWRPQVEEVILEGTLKVPAFFYLVASDGLYYSLYKPIYNKQFTVLNNYICTLDTYKMCVVLGIVVDNQ